MPKISEATREERRAAILQAAVDCLARVGYSATSMRTIATAAGLTKGGLYAYFDSKEAILLAVAQQYMERQLEAFRPAPGESGAAALERVFATYAATADAAPVQRAILDLWTFGGELPAVRAELEERYRRYLQALAGLIQYGQQDGSFRADAQPEHVAGLILAARDGLVFQVTRLGLPVPTEELTGLLQRLVGEHLSITPTRRGRPS